MENGLRSGVICSELPNPASKVILMMQSPNEYYSRGVSTEERVGVTLLILVPIVFLASIAVEVWRFHNGH